MSDGSKFLRFVFLAAATGTAFLLFAVPDTCALALREGLKLCGGTLLLSLYPFLIVSSLLAKSGAGEILGLVFRPVSKLIGIRSRSADGILLIGAAGGFAPAANAAAEGVKSGRITAGEASALLPACVCSGPSFVILTVGGQLLGSDALGVRLFASQLAAGYLAAALLNRMPKRAPASLTEEKYTEPAVMRYSFAGVIAEASVTYIKLCGFVLYFRMLARGLASFLPSRLSWLPAVLLEVSSGCDLASRTGLAASGLCCAALSLQGASVLLQVHAICPEEISLRPLLTARLIHLPASLALFYLTMPDSVQEAFNTLCGRVETMRRVPVDCALLVFFTCCLAACELTRAAERLGEKA